MGLSNEEAGAHRAAVLDGYAGLRPGWVRVSLHWSMSAAEREYLIEAVAQLARFGHRLAALYRFEPRTGAWTRTGCETRLVSDTGGAQLMAESLAAAESLAENRECKAVAALIPRRHAGLARYAALAVSHAPDVAQNGS